MHKAFKLSGFFIVLVLFINTTALSPSVVHAFGFISFEDGADGEVIQSSIPGLEFTTTDGQDWLYGDWTTSKYNGKYPEGAYTSNGNFFAWLGPNQGDGRIDFTGTGASYLSVLVSAGEPVTLKAYNSLGIRLDTASLPAPNTNTGLLQNLTVAAPFGLKIINYAIISGAGNFWLIDDLSTDAGDVEDTRNPIIFLPGLAGTKIENDTLGFGFYKEVWPRSWKLWLSEKDEHLLVMRFDKDGLNPYKNEAAYTTTKEGNIIRKEPKSNVYLATVDYFTQQRGYEEGENFIICPYDWRRDIDSLAGGALDGTLDTGTPDTPDKILHNTLDKCIQKALDQNPGATKVNILAHSMGGLVARDYIANDDQAENVDRLVTLGTPYLGLPKVALGILEGVCFIENGDDCLSYPPTVNKLVQNFPSMYQMAPGDLYYQVYPKGYIQDGSADNFMDVDPAFSLLATHNSKLASAARNYESSMGGWSNGGTNGVEVFVMVGDGLGTIGTLKEYDDGCWNPTGCPMRYKIGEHISGDKTVPVRSASMSFPPLVDLSGGVSIFYFGLVDHGALAREDEVLAKAANIFEARDDASSSYFENMASSGLENTSPTDYDPDGILKNNASSYQSEVVASTQPTPLNGRSIFFDGPVDIEIIDSVGNRMGNINGSDDWENEIPGASFNRVGESTAVFLQDGSTYTIKVSGRESGSVDVRIQIVVDDEVTETALYDEIPITESSVATLSYDPSQSMWPAFELDQDGDGDPETTFPVSTVLDSVESQDYLAPTTSFSISGTPDGNGWYSGQITVTLDAVDNAGGSGVAKTEYSFDFGTTIHSYTVPFTLDADVVTLILAKSTDMAGNDESPVSFVGVIHHTYLPIVSSSEQ